MTKRRREKGRKKDRRIPSLDDPTEPIRRGVREEPRLRRDRFSFLCLNENKVFQMKPSATQDRIAKCPTCLSSEDVVIYA
jgi:hypothetical protein